MTHTINLQSTVKNFAFYFMATAILAAFSACNSADKKSGDAPTATSATSSDEPSKDLTGKFSVDGKEYTGKVSVQHFPSTHEFSVLCQNDDFGLVQITFADEPAARTEQDIKFTKGFTHKEKNEADFSFGLFSGNSGDMVSSDDTKGSAKITKDGSNNAIEFKDVELQSNDKKTSSRLSGKIPY